MKKIICFILSIILCLSTCVCNVFAVEDTEISIKDIINYDLPYFDQNVYNWLDYIWYEPELTPELKDEMCGDVGHFPLYFSYYPVDETGNPTGIDKEAYTSEELYNLYWDSIPVDRKYIDKYFDWPRYSDINLSFNLTVIRDSIYNDYDLPDNYILALSSPLSFSDAFLEELNTYSSIERAYVIGGLLYTMSSWENFSVDAEVVTPTYSEYKDIMKYDVNYDGDLDAKDSMLMKKAIVGKEIKGNVRALDINDDGKTNGKDSLYLRKKIMGLI